jgi:hypothetical protein
LNNLEIDFDTVYNNISSNFISRIPGVAYGIPDVDARVTVNMAKREQPNVSLACVRVRLSNGKTVYQQGVGWGTAVVIILGLIISSVVAGIGFTNAGAHVAVYTLSLLIYFQAVAMVGLTAVPLPPIVQAWTQNFQWSMGIIRVQFLQSLATWYLKATTGTPSTILATLGTKSVQVLKRSIGLGGTAPSLSRRATDSIPTGEYTIRGLERVAFRAGMEPTNLFMTSVIFFCILLIFATIGVAIFSFLTTRAIHAGSMRDTRFMALRHHFQITMKGVVFRCLLIGFPPMTILSLWEFTRLDSPAEVALAVFIFFGIVGALGWAVFQVFQWARNSERSHKTAAYSLYANAMVFNKWGFLYIQFRASAYWYIIPTLIYLLIKGMFIGLGQGSGTLQAIAILVIEGAALVSACVIRPWMDKPTNAMNISICVINFLNAVFLLIFTDIFNGPGLLIGVVSIIFFIMNAVFALVLLCVILLATAYSFLQKNPETRYQPVSDNRASFIKSQTQLTNELDALGVSARGDDPRGSWAEKSLSSNGDVDRHGIVRPPIPYHDRSRASTAPSSPRVGPRRSMEPRRSREAGALPLGRQSPIVTPRTENFPEYRASNNNSYVSSPFTLFLPILTVHRPWQRGAGYDH